MKFHKALSVILHPIVIPTMGALIYFILVPNRLYTEQKTAIIVLIFVLTYLIPILLLFILKQFKLIKSYQVESIKERKNPIIFMAFLFYIIGIFFLKISHTIDLGILFYGACLGSIIIYISYIFKIKTSLHLFSMGLFTGFFLFLEYKYDIKTILFSIISILISGLLASSRLHLKAHNHQEVYIGFILGLLCPIGVSFLL